MSDETHRSMAAELSNFLVRLTAEYTGRGPTKARSYIMDDVIAIVVQDYLTRGERSLVRDGQEELVLSSRKAYQRTMREDLVAGVEQITGRTVYAFFSDNSIDPEMAVETFVMNPPQDR